MWISGRASDETALSQVDVSVDGGPFRPASGTESWRHLLDTTTYANASHSITARATDSAGNTSATTVSVTIGNAPASPGPSEQLVTPEGATIQIYPDAGGWTAQGVYELLRANALELGSLGPSLTVKVQTTYPSATTSSASQSGGVYGNYRATMYLQAGPNTTFTIRPDFIMAHEYGHAWSNYHLYLSHQGDWSSYLTARGIAGDARVDSTYNWSKGEMLADDYRMLFGSPAAVSQASYINPALADPRSVPGLRDFLLSSWALP